MPRQDYAIGVPEAGFYKEILNSDAGAFGGSNMGNGGGVMATAKSRATIGPAQYIHHAPAACRSGMFQRSGLSALHWDEYDAIIVGGGHNGLVTAAYLARAGKRVSSSNGAKCSGGCAVTEEIWPGYRVSTGAYLVSLLQERIVRELELERFGYRVMPKDPAFFSAYPDGRHLFFWQDEKKTLAEIAKFSARDAEAYPKYEAHLERLARVVESLLLVTPPELPAEAAWRFHRISEAAGRVSANSARAKSRAWSRSSRRARPIFSTSGSNRRRSRSRWRPMA